MSSGKHTGSVSKAFFVAMRPGRTDIIATSPIATGDQQQLAYVGHVVVRRGS
jgi:hypothetical protein